MLDAARTGRRDVEKERHEDIILRVLPVLNDGLAMKNVSELVIGCYMISVVLAQKAALQNEVLDGLMEAVVSSWTSETASSGLICVAVLAQQKPDATITKKVFKAILRLDHAITQLSEIATQYRTSNLLLGVVARCAEDLTKQKDSTRLDLLSSVFQGQLLGEAEMSKAMALVLNAASNAHKDGAIPLDIQTQLADLVQHFNRSEALKPIFQITITESSLDMSALEQNLQTVIDSAPEPKAIEDVEMDDATEEEQDTFTPALESLAKANFTEASFFSAQSLPVFDSLVQTFALTTGSQEKLDSFTSLPVLGKAEAAKTPRFLSFFARVFTGPYPIGTKVAALSTVSSVLESISASDLDLQALLPFLLIALADSSERIRRETAGLLALVCAVYKKSKKDDNRKIWGQETLYGQGEKSKNIQWIPSRDAQKIFERALLPGLEEYVLDPGHVARVLESTLRGSSKDSSASELKKPIRLAFFTYLCSHAVNIPLFAPKVELLKLLNNIDRTGGTTRTNELQPLLGVWRGLNDADALKTCEKERLAVSEVEGQIVQIITPKEKDALNILLSCVSPGAESMRTSLAVAIFERMKGIWSRVSEDRQAVAAERLFNIALGLSTDDTGLASHCRDVLRSVDLSGNILFQFLEKIPVSLTDMEPLAPAPKRRRTSQSNMVAMTVKDEADLSKLMDKMTFILELVDSSTPEAHPELAEGLFQALAALHHFKSQIQSGMSYLLSLALGSLLAIVNRSRESGKPQFDTSVVRADLVVDCVRTTESPQVQNVALLLVAGLSAIAPELVLHSVMPIFTFMGSSVLRKDDDYSVSVIDQTIDQVVPALIQSLRNQKRDIVSGTSELLLSFTAAFEHIPSHRRLRLFHALITKLGTQDFLFAVLAMLANRYAMDKDVLTLMTGLASDAGPTVELTVGPFELWSIKKIIKKKVY